MMSGPNNATAAAAADDNFCVDVTISASLGTDPLEGDRGRRFDELIENFFCQDIVDSAQKFCKIDVVCLSKRIMRCKLHSSWDLDSLCANVVTRPALAQHLTSSLKSVFLASDIGCSDSVPLRIFLNIREQDVELARSHFDPQYSPQIPQAQRHQSRRSLKKSSDNGGQGSQISEGSRTGQRAVVGTAAVDSIAFHGMPLINALATTQSFADSVIGSSQASARMHSEPPQSCVTRHQNRHVISFHLYVPEEYGEIQEATLVIHCCSIPMILSKDCPRLWVAECTRHSQEHMYKYTLIAKKQPTVYRRIKCFFFGSDGMVKLEDEDYRWLADISVYRDMFGYSDNHTEAGYVYFLREIINSVQEQESLNAALPEVKEWKLLQIRKFHDALAYHAIEMVLKPNSVCLEQAALVLYFLTVIEFSDKTNDSSKKTNIGLLLANLQDCSLENLLNTFMSFRVREMLVFLLRVVCKDITRFHVAYYCYPALSSSHLVSALVDVEGNCKDTTFVKKVIDRLEKLVPSKIGAEEVLVKLIDYIESIPSLLEAYRILKHSSLTDVCAIRDSEKRIIQRIESQITTFTDTGHFKSMKRLAVDLQKDCPDLFQLLSKSFIKQILAILSKYPNIQAYEDEVYSLIVLPGMFIEALDQKLLLNMLATSSMSSASSVFSKILSQAELVIIVQPQDLFESLKAWLVKRRALSVSECRDAFLDMMSLARVNVFQSMTKAVEVEIKNWCIYNMSQVLESKYFRDSKNCIDLALVCGFDELDLTVMESLRASIETAVINIMTENIYSSKWQAIEVQKLSHVVCSDSAFLEQCIIQKVFNLFCSSSIELIHGEFITMLKGRKFWSLLQPEDMRTFIKQWLKKAEDHCAAKALKLKKSSLNEHRMLYLYEYLYDLKMLQFPIDFRSICDDMELEVKAKCLKLKIKAMMDNADLIKEDAVALLEDHTIMAESSSMSLSEVQLDMKRIGEKKSWKIPNRSGHRMLLNSIAHHLNDLDSDYKRKQFVFSNCKFWKTVLFYHDVHCNEFDNHEALARCRLILKTFANDIAKAAITVEEYEMVNKLDTTDNECILLIEIFYSGKRNFSQHWKSFENVLVQTGTTLKALELFTKGFLPKILGSLEISDLEVVQKAIQMANLKMNPDSKCPIGDIGTAGFYDILKELCPVCDEMRRYIKMQTFCSLCSSILPEIQLCHSESDALRSEDLETSCTLLFDESLEVPVLPSTSNTTFNPTTLQVAKFVQDECVSRYGIWLGDISKDDATLNQILQYSSNGSTICDEFRNAAQLWKISVSKELYSTLDWIKELDKHKDRVESIKNTLTVFSFKTVESQLLKNIETFFTCLRDQKDVTVLMMKNAMNGLRGPLGEDNNNWYDVLSELSKASELVKFLRTLLNEDLRNLIDAVEERSEQTIDESTVSNLIHVKRLTQPVLKVDHTTPEELLECLKMSLYKEHDKGEGMAARINNCSHHVHSLKALYLHVANRGELTKEIIGNAMTNGSYKWIVNEAMPACSITLSFKVSKGAKTELSSYDADRLSDLRSRALLISTSDKKVIDDDKKGKKKLTTELKDFVRIVDLSNEICTTLTRLHNLGHFSYKEFVKKISPSKYIYDEMCTFLTSQQRELEDWVKLLHENREKFSSLNFLYSDQLLLMSSFLKSHAATAELTNQVHSILQFISPGSTVEDLRKVKNITPSDNSKQTLEQVGSAVDSMMQQVPCKRKYFPTNAKFYKQAADANAVVQPGVLYIVHLEQKSTQTIPILLSLYASTSNKFPIPSEVLFCHDLTTSEEIHLLIQRSLKSIDGNLHCICNVEKLPDNLQYELVDELRIIVEKKGCVQNRLAVICRGRIHHPIVDYFSSFVHHLQGFDGPTLQSCLREVWSDVFMVTSVVPGLGKTEHVNATSANQGLKLSSVHISGPISRDNLVSKLSAIGTRKTGVLHLDIAEVDDPNFLDACLFEFIVLGCLCSYTKVVCLPVQHIFLEVANSVHNRLRDSFVVLSCFNRIHLIWENYNNFIVSKHISSPVQIVCQYLKRLDEGTLDSTDVSLYGNVCVKPLDSSVCRQMLLKYFASAADMSFSIIEIFINVFSEQLKKLSSSQYFRICNLRGMLGDKEPIDVRSKLVLALLEVAKEFACRSVQACRSLQASTQDALAADPRDTSSKTKATAAELMASRLSGMLNWEDTNHLLIVFNSIDSQTVSAVYRDIKKVPVKIKDLFKLQLRIEELPDFKNYKQADLKLLLDKLAKTNVSNTKDVNVDQSYALTQDNLLKMVLILLRLRANVPVVIMGETGCGKTSLVRYLAQICSVSFEQFSIHAGTTAADIEDKVRQCNEKCLKDRKKQMWLFLDEINTCEHMGLLTRIICHHTCFGTPLAANIKFIAACNPYRLRQETEIRSAGLESKFKTDEYSKLVYRVHSLPETLIDYVWDYGTLHPKDERLYISEMVRKTVQDQKCLESLQESIVKLLVFSQEFIRKVEENDWCVSLRDVQRCQILILNFLKVLNTKSCCPQNEQRSTEPIPFCAVVLALAHCYQSRLAKTQQRLSYWKFCAEVLYRSSNNYPKLMKLVRMEQMDFLNRMEIPPGIAKNTALCENVFVILICILNHMPVFLVGKPGCSKSLSMQLIKSNLRGKDSNDKFFQTLPNLYIVSYQGSESSTSDGIIKVFQKAEKYLQANANEHVLPVVLLDEVGLAEASKFNPLKVLHSILEPETGKLPNVAVVGISNWSLDAAKMNRAIHLSRPDMDVEELRETGLSISENLTEKPSFFSSCKSRPTVQKDTLRALAEAYYEYQANQRVKNFHGLRDYYSLIKYISSMSQNTNFESIFEDSTTIIQKGLMRNFGGLSDELKKIVNLFLSHTKLQNTKILTWTAEDLITENVNDQTARHLMLITNGDSALGILLNSLSKICRKYTVIFGSKYDEDQSEDYSYRILNRIILSMETDGVLVLKDLDTIYGSLYDMLNQNYCRVGMKNNCRIALGPYSNPMCQVNDKFRCIVLVGENRVDYADPPFLNRFEKQILRFEDIIDNDLVDLINALKEWVHEFSTVPQSHFTAEQAFIGFGKDTIPSLVYQIANNKMQNLPPGEKLEKCKSALLWTVAPDAVVRLSKSLLADRDMSEVEKIQAQYFSLPVHQGLSHALSSISFQQDECPPRFTNNTNLHVVVYTYSSTHINLSEILKQFDPVQVEKLSAFKSEKQLTKHLRKFFESSASLLVVQCQPYQDGQHISLAKFQIEELQREFQKAMNSKYICVVMHMERTAMSSDASAWQFNFLSGWQLLTVDNVEDPLDHPLTTLLTETVGDILRSKFKPINHCIKDNLVWAFSCTSSSYGERSIEEFCKIVSKISDSESLISCLAGHILEYIEKSEESSNYLDVEKWKIKVALDMHILHSATTFTDAIKQYLTQRVTIPLANIVHKLESLSSLHSYDSSPTKWKEMFSSPELALIDLSNIVIPQGPGYFKIDHKPLKLEAPFSYHYIRRLAEYEDLFMHDLLQVETDAGDTQDHDVAAKNSYVALFSQYRALFEKELNQLLEIKLLPKFELQFCRDLCNIATVGQPLEEEDRVALVHWFISFKSFKHQETDALTLVTESMLCIWKFKPLLQALLDLMTECRSILRNDVKTTLLEMNTNLNGVNSKIQMTMKYCDSEYSDDIISVSHDNEEDGIGVEVVEQSNDEAEHILEDEHHIITTETANKNQTIDDETVKSDNDDMILSGQGELDSDHSEMHDEYLCSKSLGNAEQLNLQIQPNAGGHGKQIGSVDCGQYSISNAYIGAGDSNANDETCRDDYGEIHTEYPAAETFVATYVEPAHDKHKDNLEHVDEGDHPVLAQNDSEENEQHLDQDYELAYVKKLDHLAQDQYDENVEHLDPDLHHELAHHENVNEMDEDDHPDETLVARLCQLLIPSRNVIDECRGFNSWHMKVSSVLTFGSSVSSYPPVVHALRIFNDLANLLHHCGVSEPTSEEFLVHLSEQLDLSKLESEFDSVDLLQKIFDISDMLKQERIGAEDIQQFVSMFVLRCIDVNPESEILSHFLQLSALGQLPDKCLHHMEFLLRRVLLEVGDAQTLREILTKYIRADDDTVIKELSQLVHLNAALTHISGKDPTLLVIVVDAVKHLVFDTYDWSNLKYVQAGHEILGIYKAAVDVLNHDDSNCSPLKIVSAVAYLKTFLHHLVPIIITDTEHNSCEEHRLLYQNVNPYLSSSYGGRHCVFYLLKELKVDKTLCSLIRVVHNIEKWMSNLSQVTFPDDELTRSIGYRFLGDESDRNMKLEHDLLMLDTMGKSVEEYLEQSLKSEKGMIELFQTLVNITYFPGTLRQLTDSERQIGPWLKQRVKCNKLSGILIERLGCEKSFAIALLQLTPESPFTQQQKASVIVHQLCILIAGQKHIDSLLWVCLAQPINLPLMEIISHLQAHIDKAANERDRVTMNGPFFVCKCWFRILVLETRDKCPMCNCEWPNMATLMQDASSALKLPSESGCSLISRTIVKLLLNASVIGSVALDVTSEQHLKSQYDISVTTLQCNFDDSWTSLEQYMQLSTADVALFLHYMIHLLDSGGCSAVSSVKTWKDIMGNLETLQRDICEQMKKLQFCGDFVYYRNKIMSCHDLVVRHNVLEIVEPTSEEHDGQTDMCKLFRITKKRTVEDMKGAFYMDRNDKQYPLVDVFFNMTRKLNLLQHMLPLVKWFRTIQRIVNNTLNRQYCRTTVVNVFINAPSKQREQVKLNFEKFRASWECFRDKENIQLLRTVDESIPEDLPQINLQCSLQSVLIENVESVFYRVMKVLCTIQNSFLDQLLVIAQSGTCPSVLFLMKNFAGVAAVNCVLLQNVKENQLILYNRDKLVENLTIFAQNDPRFGYGNMVAYNFLKIEMELANELALGKVHLVLNHTFPVCTYANELFVNCATVLQEFKSIIPQEPLRQAIKDGIEDRRRNNPEYINELMTKTEILLCLVKRTHVTADETIAKYIKTWLQSLPGGFSADLLPSGGEPLRLSHLVALYEFVENIQADFVIDSLPDCYKKKLTAKLEDELKQFIDSNYIQPPSSIQTAFRRFIVRYLTSFDAEDQVMLNEPLFRWMSNISLWPDGVKENGTLTTTENDAKPKSLCTEFPKMLTLEHTYYALSYVNDMLQKRLEATRLPLLRQTASAEMKSPVVKVGARSRTRGNVGKT